MAVLEKKSQVSMKNAEAAIVDQLREGKPLRAEIAVERLLADDCEKRFFEIVGIYAELLLARMPLIESTEGVVEDEAVESLIFCAAVLSERVAELDAVRAQFANKYGREFCDNVLVRAEAAQKALPSSAGGQPSPVPAAPVARDGTPLPPSKVAPRLLLLNEAPNRLQDRDTVVARVAKIAHAAGVSYTPTPPAAEYASTPTTADLIPALAAADSHPGFSSSSPPPPRPTNNTLDFEDPWAGGTATTVATAATPGGPSQQSPEGSRHPGTNTLEEGAVPHLPSAPRDPPRAGKAAAAPANKIPSSGDDDFDSLMSRIAALRGGKTVSGYEYRHLHGDDYGGNGDDDLPGEGGGGGGGGGGLPTSTVSPFDLRELADLTADVKASAEEELAAELAKGKSERAALEEEAKLAREALAEVESARQELEARHREEEERAAKKLAEREEELRTLLAKAEDEVSAAKEREEALRKETEEASTGAKEQLLCKICFEKPYNMVFTPCGHTGACEACALEKDWETCPFCRAPVTEVLRSYVP